MCHWLVPPRSNATELLDQHPVASASLARNLHEMAWLYRWSGGAGLGGRALRHLVGQSNTCLTLLDVASGNGAGALHLAWQAARTNIHLSPIISDLQTGVIRVVQHTTGIAARIVQADGLHQPWRTASVDIVHCAQSLHHFNPETASRLLRECARVARLGIIVVDLQRSWPGYLGARLAALGPMSALGRHDGPLSVLRAYTSAEAQMLAHSAGLQTITMLRSPVYWALIAQAPASHRFSNATA